MTSKRRREAEASEKPGKANHAGSDSVEEKRAKVQSDDDELKVGIQFLFSL